MHLTNTGDMVGAGAACRKSVALDSTSWSAYWNRGNYQMATGDRFGASHDYTKAKSLNPKAPVLARAFSYDLPATYVVLGIPGSSAQLAEAHN